MAERHAGLLPLAHLGLAARAAAAPGGAGVGMAEVAVGGLLLLRADAAADGFAAAVEPALGFALPTAPNGTSGGAAATAFWLGPDEWLIAVQDAPAPLTARLAEALAGRHCALLDVSASRAVLRLSGPRVRGLLAAGCRLDLHARGFAVGACAQSTLALADVLLHRREDDAHGAVFEVYVARSYADYLWRWLEAAAGEFGLAVLQATPVEVSRPAP